MIEMNPPFFRFRPRQARPRVVIAGANFAGLEAAMGLPAGFRVTVIDPRLDFEFIPNIHELVSGYKRPGRLRFAKEKILSRKGHEFFQDEVTSIDPESSRLITSSGAQFGYDACVVAVGGVDGLPPARADDLSPVIPFKSIRDAQAIAIRIGHLIDSGKWASVVIVGGGLEGVEVLGEILRRHRRHTALEIHVIERGGRLLSAAPETVDLEIRRICRDFPVFFHLNESVARIAKKRIELSSGQMIKGDLIIWTGGIVPPPLLAESGLKLPSDTWAPVHPTLQSRYSEKVFVIGDAALSPASAGKQAYHAMDMGRLAAENLKRFLAEKPLGHFTPSEKPVLLSFGDLDTFLIGREMVLAGTALAGLKEAVFQYTMAHYDPARRLGYLWNTLERTGFGGLKLSLSNLKSIEALARLKNLRLLRPPPAAACQETADPERIRAAGG